MDERRRFLVRGKVQGVGFRDYIAKRAQLLGLSGWVRNLPDGESIEAVAEGDIASLETFAQEMMHGPRGAHVTGYQAEPYRANKTLKAPFAVRK